MLSRADEAALDTHYLVVRLNDHISHCGPHRDENGSNKSYLSVASVWEVVIKHQIGKLPCHGAEILLPSLRERHGIASLLITESTLRFLPGLAPLHRDPFDRILICQALEHGLTIVTVDAAVQSYLRPNALTLEAY
jgi:PIN domain nuclease of toxin-antitoxin system